MLSPLRATVANGTSVPATAISVPTNEFGTKTAFHEQLDMLPYSAQAGDIMTEGRLCTLAYRHARLIPSQYQRILFQREREKVARQDHGNQKLKQPE